jgi:hypothetical protein
MNQKLQKNFCIKFEVSKDVYKLGECQHCKRLVAGLGLEPIKIFFRDQMLQLNS